MTIVEALKSRRVALMKSDKIMYWDGLNCVWEVTKTTQKRFPSTIGMETMQQRTKILISTKNESEAVTELLKG